LLYDNNNASMCIFICLFFHQIIDDMKKIFSKGEGEYLNEM